MMHTRKKKVRMVSKVVLVAFGAILFLVPFYLVIVNSVKTQGEIISNPFSFPTQLQWNNYINSWKTIDMSAALSNTVIVTFSSTLVITISSAMVAYWIVRQPNRYTIIFERLLMCSVLIPFTTIMLPVVKTLSALGLSGTLFGGIICYSGMGLAFAVFIMRGAVVAIPKELEEAALLDGCSIYQTFFRIVLPLMLPTMISVVILDVFWVWNDYNIALVVMNTSATKTIQLSINSLFSQYISRWDIALPALVMGIAPILVTNVLLQKKVMEGMTAGAIKG